MTCTYNTYNAYYNLLVLVLIKCLISKSPWKRFGELFDKSLKSERQGGNIMFTFCKTLTKS